MQDFEIHYISRQTIARKSRAFEERNSSGIFERAHSTLDVTHSSCLRTQTNQDIHPTPRSTRLPEYACGGGIRVWG